ncbi:translocation/assembly module TamB domain-containing protein [Arcobacter lanthieri]|uniref:translocation/assembly module TamB domain-containing protein n=1 Tax=Aliarcobacter lanthieri TaxID=1355374 RepID=UPI0019221133|nr:translocation/assembly module TamB domain-containing protein [Aliarcobacter lanthieri]MBL3520557.1 translocation/assembly module TamB domain-containing protein [Aliarcobacter lanthieri]
MKILKIIKYLFFILTLIFCISFLYIITSSQLTQKVFDYISLEIPLKYSKIEGSLYTGIKIEDLNYDDMIKAKSLYIKPSLLSLLIKEVYIYDLKIEDIVLEDKLFSFLNEPKDEEQDSSLEIPFTLFIKNFDANLNDFIYEEQRIDEVNLSIKNLNSNLKDNVSGNIITTIKSNLADIEASINLDKNNYILSSKIDLKKDVISSLLVESKGNLEKVDFKINSKELNIENIEQQLNIENINIIGNYDIKNLNLEISSLTSNLRYDEINSNIEGKAKLLNNDLETLTFNIDLQTTIQKTIFEALQKDLFIKSNISGNLKEITFTNNLESNEINIDKTSIKIEDSSLLKGIVKIFDKDIEVLADSTIRTNLADQKSKIELKLNIDEIDKLNINSTTMIENIRNYEEFNLKNIGNIKILSNYTKGILDIDLNSKILDISLKSNNLKKFIFETYIKDINPNNFYELDKSIKISKINGKIKGDFEENLSLNADMVLNDSFIINSNFKTKKDNFEVVLKNNSLSSNIEKLGEIINIKVNIKELKNFEKELNKILDIPTLNLSGLIDANLQLTSNKIDFELNSPKISFENESLEKISIKGNFKEETIVFDRLDFNIGKTYDINLQKKLTLLRPAFFNISSFDGDIAFENILLKSSKQDKNIVLNIVTKDLFLEHSSYASLILNTNLKINIDEEDNKIFVSGDVKANNLKAFYNIPALSISKDKDIVIVSKKDTIIEKDFFIDNIGLDLLIIADDVEYSVKNIDLKAKVNLNIKKEFTKGVKIFGSVQGVEGTFSELGKTYQISNSSVNFKGLEAINPILDIKASTKVDNIEISIFISGTLENPRLTLNSNPMMNQKDILSYLIFGTNFASDSKNTQSKESQASLFLLNELSKDYAKELGVDMIYFQYDPTTQYIETSIGKNIGEKNKVVLKNKSQSGQIILMRELTKLWNIELGFEEKTQSLDLIYKKRY